MDSVPPPPPDGDQKNIIDKLAQFVARNGPEFENMTKFFARIIDCFFCELTMVNSVRTDHKFFPFSIEKHLNSMFFLQKSLLEMKYLLLQGILLCLHF